MAHGQECGPVIRSFHCNQATNRAPNSKMFFGDQKVITLSIELLIEILFRATKFSFLTIFWEISPSIINLESSNVLDIITVTKNDSAGLEKTAESISAQIKLGNCKWFVIDGGSQSDEMHRIKSVCKATDATLVEGSLGIFESMNLGFHLGKNPIVVFLNSGDAFFTRDNVVESIIASFKDRNWNWAVGDTLAVDENDLVMWKWPMPRLHGYMLRFGLLSYCHQATFMKRDFLRVFMPYDSDTIFSDWIMSLRLKSISKPFKLNFVTTTFLAGGISSNVSADYWSKESSRLRIRYGLAILNSKRLDELSIDLMSRIWRVNQKWQTIKSQKQF